MHQQVYIPIWKQAPYIRLLVPLIAGILLQWHFPVRLPVIISALISFTAASWLFLRFPLPTKFLLRPLQGIILQLLFLSLGALLTWASDIRHADKWYGHHYTNGSYLLVRMGEPLLEKAKSFKAEAYVEAVVENEKVIPTKGKLLLYFSKDSTQKKLQYGDRIIIHKNLQAIKNSGNPGAFNYQRYAAFQGIFHNVFLKDKDWAVVAGSHASSANFFWRFIFNAREQVLSILKNTIKTGRDELGIAQALLIGYTNDLDKDLVQAYSNTGVVHIIAISGMHLGLIYVLLIWVFAKIPLVNRSKMLQLILILTCLWLFALLTGASPSVLRAAVMFSCIAIGKNMKKQVSIYTSLAASAFILLCINPYYLWAVGFQLSYLAVLGIVIFQKPIYNCLYIKNKWLDKVWKLASVSTAAQLLTFPVCIYYFHQFPNLFLFTNLVAVPLATLILYAAIALVCFSWVPFLDVYLGKLVGALTWLMNKFILWVNELAFAVWDRIPATLFSTWLLYATLIAFAAWLLQKNKSYFTVGLLSLLVFLGVSTYNKWELQKQQKIIVYNVPQQQAIDFVVGSQYQFIGDSILLADGLLQNFHLKPGRIAAQLNHRSNYLPAVADHYPFYQVGNKKILVLSQSIRFLSTMQMPTLDLLIISKNPKINLVELLQTFNLKQVVVDASNPAWKIATWRKQCETRSVKFHSITDKGAFVYNFGI